MRCLLKGTVVSEWFLFSHARDWVVLLCLGDRVDGSCSQCVAQGSRIERERDRDREREIGATEAEEEDKQDIRIGQGLDRQVDRAFVLCYDMTRPIVC